VEVDRGLPVDAGAGRPERDLPGLWIDQPPVLVVGLVCQRAGDLLQIEGAQVNHETGIDPLHASAQRATRAADGRSTLRAAPVN
jgi:hypothetical protein